MKVTPHEERLSFTINVLDNTGKPIFTKSEPSKSYVKQWNQMYNRACGGAPSITDVNNVTAAAGLFAAWGDATAGIGVTPQGIRAGLGSNAVTINDINLQTPCAEGIGLNQFNHQAQSFVAPAVVGSTISFSLKRTLINNSAAPISVTEIGAVNLFYQAAVSHFGLICRDVFGAISIPIGATIGVTYILSVTV